MTWWADPKFKDGLGYLCICGHRATKHGKDGVISYCVDCPCAEFVKDKMSEDLQICYQKYMGCRSCESLRFRVNSQREAIKGLTDELLARLTEIKTLEEALSRYD